MSAETTTADEETTATTAEDTTTAGIPTTGKIFINYLLTYDSYVSVYNR
jgi:hypothetical protein